MAAALVAAACSSSGGGSSGPMLGGDGATSGATNAGTGGGASSGGITGGASAGSDGTALVESLTLTRASAVIPIGGQQEFAARATFSDGSLRDVSSTAAWSTSAPNVASVDNGVVTALSTGTVTVSATFQGLSASAPVTVSDAVLTAISVTPTTVTVPAGVRVTLTATGLYSDGATRDVTGLVTWTTGNGAIATVTDAGLLSGVASGTTTITATAGALHASATVTVTAATLQALAVTPDAVSLPAGFSDRLTATGTFSDAGTLDVTGQARWTSSAPAVATVDAAGHVTARAVGSATITATLDGRSVAVPVTVTSAVLVALQVTPDLPSVPAGLDEHFTATGIFSDQSSRDLSGAVTWSISDASVAIVSASGVVTGLRTGTTTITANLGAATDSTTVTITPATLMSVDVLPPAVTLAKGTGALLQAMATYSDGFVADVTSQALWSSDSSVVSVSADPLGAVVTGLTIGTANVSAAFGGASDVATVTVTAATLASLSVEPPSASIPAGLTQQLVATGTFSDQTTQDLTDQVTWTSSDHAVASVSASGLVTGIVAGSATITATLLGASAASTVTVTAASLEGISVAPTAVRVAAGYKVQFAATARFSDGSTHDVTAQALWTSSNRSILTISNAGSTKGLATGIAAGTATVTATFAGASSSAAVTVTGGRLVTLTIAPDQFSAQAGSTVQLTATATFDDGSTLDMTRQCSWKSDAKRTARVSQSGLVTASKRGTVTITATSSGVRASARGTVN